MHTHHLTRRIALPRPMLTPRYGRTVSKTSACTAALPLGGTPVRVYSLRRGSDGLTEQRLLYRFRGAV